jgi:hypothetical protein
MKKECNTPDCTRKCNNQAPYCHVCKKLNNPEEARAKYRADTYKYQLNGYLKKASRAELQQLLARLATQLAEDI